MRSRHLDSGAFGAPARRKHLSARVRGVLSERSESKDPERAFGGLASRRQPARPGRTLKRDTLRTTT